MKSNSFSIIKLGIWIVVAVALLPGISYAQCSGTGTEQDTFGVKMMFPTYTAGALPWMLGIGNFTGRMKDSQKVSGSGLNTTMDLNGQERNSVYATTPCDGITDHKKAASQGYMCSPKDWKNFEMTCYFYTTDLGGDEFTMYGRGGRHTGSGYPDGCLGSAYKASVALNGQTRWGKEQWHVSYDYNGGGGWKSSGVNVNGKWVGYKIIIYNIGTGANPDVAIELWLDGGNNTTAPGNQWQLVNKVIDKGGWGSDGGECGGTSDQKIIWGGPLVTFRTDLGGVKIKWASVREIDPNATFSSKPSVSVSKSDAVCGNTTGSATATATGGSGTYSYLWNSGQTTSVVSGLSPGNYTVTVTEGSGCTGTSAITIVSFPSPVIATSASDVKCFGGSDGSATANTTSGTSPYVYSWNIGDTAVKYCIPASVAANGDDGNVPANAFDGNLASRWSYNLIGAHITADLGVKKTISSLEIAWYNGDQRSSNFVISLSDDGISFSNAYTGISSGTTLSPEKYSFAKVAGRYVRVTVNGNSLNNWASITEINILGTENASSPSVGGLTAGTYLVTVTDASGCSVIKTVTVSEPAALSTSTSFTPDDGSNNGTASVTVTGGTPNYKYQWNTIPVQVTAVATGLKAGTFTVTVTDANNCSTITTVSVTSQPTGVGMRSQDKSFFTLSPNPAGDMIYISPGAFMGRTLIRITGILGQIVFEKEIQVDGIRDIPIQTGNFNKGIYYLSVICEENSSTQKFVKD